MEEVVLKRPHQRAAFRDDAITGVGARTQVEVSNFSTGTFPPQYRSQVVIEQSDVRLGQHRGVSTEEDQSVKEFSEFEEQIGRPLTPDERQLRYDELLALIEASLHGSETAAINSPVSASLVSHPRPMAAVDDPYRRLGDAEMTSTISSSEYHMEASDPPTLQIRDHRGLRYGQDDSLGRTPSPVTSMTSIESEVTPGMRMELRQKRRIIEEVAVYDSRTFYEDQSPKRSRHRDDALPSSAAVRVEHAPVVEHHVVEPSPATVHVQPELSTSTSVAAEQPSRTFAVTGSIQVPEDIEKVDVPERQAAVVVVTCVAATMERPPDTVDVTRDSGGDSTSVTYVVHHAVPGKMASGDVGIRSNDVPHRDLRTDLAETPSMDIRKKGKAKSRDYGPVLETVTYVVCYQDPDGDESCRNVINELHRPNYRITGRVGPTSSIEDTAESYTMTGVSGGPPPYSEEQESLYLAILNYAARSQDNLQREVPGRVTYITQQDFPKAIDSSTLSLSRKGPTVEARESSPPPTPTRDDDDDDVVWVKQKFVVVEPAQAEVEVPTSTTADVFSDAMDIVHQAEADADVSPPTMRTEYRGWRKDDEVEVKRPAADVVLPRYQVDVYAEASADEHVERFISTEASPADEVVVTTSVSCPSYPPADAELYVREQPAKSSAQFTYQAADETPEVHGFPDAEITTTRAYVFHEQLPTVDVKLSGMEPLTSEVDVATTPVSAYVEVTAAGSDTFSRTYVVHRDWPSLKAPPSGSVNLDAGGRYGSLAEALGAFASGDISTNTYVVHYDWPTAAKPTVVSGAEEEAEESIAIQHQTASFHEEVPHMFVVHQRESPSPQTTPRHTAAAHVEKDIGIPAADAAHEAETPTIELPENLVSHVYIVRRDWPKLSVPQPNVGQDVSVRLGTPSNISPAPTGDMTTGTYVVHYDWPITKADLSERQKIAGVPTHVRVTEPAEVKITTTAAAAAPPTDAEALAPKPRVTFAPTVVETNLDLVSPSAVDVDTVPKTTHEVQYDLPPEHTIEPSTALTAAAVDVEPVVIRVPHISVVAEGPAHYDWPFPKAKAPAAGLSARITIEEPARGAEVSVRDKTDVEVGEPSQKVVFHYDVPAVEVQEPELIQAGGVDTTYDSDMERDWPWFKADSPAVRQKPTVSEIPLIPVAVEVIPGGDSEGPPRELTSKTYIVRRDWPELKLVVSRPPSDIGLSGALTSDSYRRDITTKTYIVNYEWPLAKPKPKDSTADKAAEPGAFTSAEDDSEMSPTYLARIERSRVKIHLPGPDRSREAEVEVIPPEADDEQTVPSPPSENSVTRTYIVHHDWPRVRLLLSEPKPNITDDDLFTSRQMDSVTYIVHYDWPSRKATVPVEEPREIFTEEMPSTNVELLARYGTDKEFDAAVDLSPPTAQELPAVRVRPPEPRRVEFEQPVVEVVAIKEPEVRLRLETDIDEVLGRGTEDVVVQHDLPPVKIEQPEQIHIRQPAIAGLPRIPEPMIDHSIRLETDIDLPDVEPAASVSAAVDVPSPVTHIEADREKDIEPVAVCVLAPSGDVVTRTYIVQHDWPKVKLTLSERKRKLDTGLQIEAGRQLISRTYIVQYDWPSLKAKAPPAGPTARITIEEPDSGAEVAMQRNTDIEVSEPSQKVVFHYDVPTVEVQEPEPIRVREPSIEVIAMAGTDITDVDVGAAAAGPTVMLAGEDTPSAELTSHTYIVHRDWPRVQLILPEPKRVLAAAGVGTDGASGTVERKTYIVHYDWPTKGKKVVSIKAQSEVSEQPGPPAIAVERTEVVSPTVPETSGRDEHVEPAAVTVVAPSGDVITHTYIVHHDWPGVKLTLSEPKRLDAGSRIVPGVDADRQLVSRTYVVHYDWPPLTVKTTQPTEPSARIVVEEQVTVRGKPETGDATVSEPLPSVTVQYDVPIVEIQEPEPINIAEPTVKMITEPIPEPKISTVVPLYAETDIDVDVTVGEPVPNVVVQHDFVPTVQIDEAEPNLFPEAAVQTIIAEPKPKVDLRLRYETDIDLAIAEASAPSAATAADIPVAITYVDKGKDEAPEPRITIVAPSGDVVTRTYIVHHDWPRVKLTLSEPKRKLDTGLQVESQVESDRQLISRTYIVNYDWPSLKAKAPAAAPSARITIEEPARGSEVPVRGITDVEVGEPSQKVVFHYDIPTVEVQEPEPIQVREPSIEVRAMASTDVTDVDVGAAAAGPTVMLAGEATPSAELTSHTYIVHRDWPRVQLVLPEPKRVLAAAGVGTDGASGTVERKTYVVHYDWPTKGKKVVSIKAQSEVSEQPGPPAIEVERTEVVSPTLPETSAVTIVTPSADVTTHIYVVHHDWPTVKLTLSEPRRRLDTGPHIEPGAEADGQLVSRTYVVHYDWPSLKVKATQPIGPSARIVTEEPESGAEVVVHGEPEIDVDATVSEPLPSVVVQYDVSEVKIREPEPIPVLEPSVKVIAEPQPEPETVVEVPAGSGVGIDVDVTYRKLVVQPDFVPSIQIQEAEPDWISEPAVETVAEPQPEIDIRLRYESDVDLPVVEPAVPPDVGVAVPVAVTYVDEGKDKFAEPTITVIAPSEDVETHTYIVHHKWPKVKLTLSEPKAKLGVSPETEEGVAAPSSKVISLTYIVNWPSMKGKPDKHVPEVTAEIEIEKPTAVQVAEPASVEVRVDEERRPSPVPVAKVELTEIEIKGAITTRDVPEIAVTVPAAAAAPGAVTYVDDHVEPTIAIVAPSENVDKHIYIVHHDWPTVRLTLPEPKRKLDVSGLADVEEGISAPSGKVISLTYVVNWPSMKAKPEKHVPHTAADIEVQAPTILSAEPAAIEVGVDEEPKPSHDAEAEMPEVEAKAAAITAPDVSISAVTVTDEDKIAVPAAVSISVAAGEEVLCTYVVHHDWPRVKLIVPEPKRPLAPGAGEDVDVDKISRTYLVHYDWPVLQITGYPTPFREEVPEVPAPEMPSTEFEAETVAEGRGIPVQKQISETVNVDYDVVQITPPAVIVEGGFEAPEVARPAPYEERPRPEIAEAVAVGASVSEPESDVIRIREADEIEFPGISIEKEITVIQPSIEVERRGEVEVAEYPAVEGVQEAEKLAPSADVSVEVEKPDVEISIQPSDVDTPKTTKELRIGAPAPEIETEVPTVEKVPEEETVTFIVHYEEPTIGARMSPTDDVRISFRKKQRAGSDEVRILLRPIHEPVAAGDVTTASGLPSLPHHAVVAIDIGTTFSGYAFSITTKTRGKDAEDEDGRPRQQQQQRTSKYLEPGSVTVMRRLEPGDPGVVNHKSPTTLLLDPTGRFHSFGFTARDFYHDLSPREARRWLYFDKFKMALHNSKDADIKAEISATNGQQMLALTIFSHALSFFRSRALLEISDQSGAKVASDDIRWIITVPAIWHDPAKQLMRRAAYQAGIASEERPEQLVISLEPEAASIFVRRQHLHQLVGAEEIQQPGLQRPRSPKPGRLSASPERPPPHPSPTAERLAVHSELSGDTFTRTTIRWSFRRQASPDYVEETVAEEVDIPGTRYMVVDCGGGTIDITVHELIAAGQPVSELHNVCGAPFGSTEVDAEFERLLVAVFGEDFIDVFKSKRPAGWVDLMMAFESRKRAANPFKNKSLNVSLPFSFIDYHKKYRNSPVELAVRSYGDRDVTWSSQGMLRLSPRAMRRLFQPTLDHIKQLIGKVLNEPSLRGIKFMFLVGGFADSPMLQTEVRSEFQHVLKVIIPNEISLAVLRGAVCFGVDPISFTLRRALSTYAVAVTRPFVRGRDPHRKLLRRDHVDWCSDALDVLVSAGQRVCLGETVVRLYAPAAVGSSRGGRAGSPSPTGPSPSKAVFDFYRSDRSDVRYTTDHGVTPCGSLALEFDQQEVDDAEERSGTTSKSSVVVELRVTFGREELRLCAVDTMSGRSARTTVNFACQ